MSRLSNFAAILMLISFIMLLAGCSDSNSSEPVLEGDENSAYAELENQMFVMANASIDSLGDLNQVSFSRANTLYRGAVSKDPSNARANFGAGLTELLSIYSDPAVISMMRRWEAFAQGGGFSSPPPLPYGTGSMSVPVQALAKNTVKIIQAAMVDPPLVGEMQNMVRNILVPRIDYALARLAVVEQDTAFEFPISGKMQGNIHYSSVYLDNTEVFIIDGVLRGLKAFAEQFLVYRFELTAYNNAALIQAMQPDNTTFFYRSTDGIARSQGVLNDITSMIGKFRSAINYLKSETDDQSDDLIKNVSISDLDTTLYYLNEALNKITTPQTVKIKDGDTDDNDYTLVLNVSTFFNNPPQNPKTAWLPAYTIDSTSDGEEIVWHWQATSYSLFIFPDPTLSGLVVSITNDNTLSTDMNENLKRLFHVDESYPME